jgi:hypothetical protein
MKDREDQIVLNRNDLNHALASMDIYTDDMTFSTFFEKKKKDLKVLSTINDFVRPN